MLTFIKKTLVILQNTDPHISVYQTLHRQYSQITEHKFLSVFQDKKRACQWNIQYHIFPHVNAILSGVNIDINKNSFIL